MKNLVRILGVLVVVMSGMFVGGSIVTLVLAVRFHDQCGGQDAVCSETGGTFWVASAESVALIVVAGFVGYLTFRRLVQRRD
jgi:hypothetical protein